MKIGIGFIKRKYFTLASDFDVKKFLHCKKYCGFNLKKLVTWLP